MLDINETKRPDAIEVHVCRKIGAAKKHDLSKDDYELLMQLNIIKGKFEIPIKEQPPLYQIIEKRINASFTFRITDARLVLLLAVISAGRVGTTVMYLWYLQFWCYKNNVTELDLTTFSMRIFPMGFLSIDDLHQIWLGQKVKGESHIVNLVDYASAGESIQFPKIIVDTTGEPTIKYPAK